jgi:hypothetical protein
LGEEQGLGGGDTGMLDLGACAGYVPMSGYRETPRVGYIRD